MKNRVLFCLLILSLKGFSQRNYNYFFDVRDAQDSQEYSKALELTNHELKYVDDSLSKSKCYQTISNAYVNMRQYDSALVAIQKSMQFQFDESLYNKRGDIYLKLNKRDSACLDFKRAKQSNYNNRIEKHCAINWDYNRVIKGQYTDTSLFDYFVSSYYKDCYKKLTDTTYTCKIPKFKAGHWQAYFDFASTKTFKERFLVGDTAKTITYFINGTKRAESWELQNPYKWIFEAEYWGNGHVHYKINPSKQSFKRIHHYWPNGKLKFEGSWEAGRFYGDNISYYSNGKIQKINHLKPYTRKNEPRYAKDSIKMECFDKHGNRTPVTPDTLTKSINDIGAPRISFNYLEKWKEYLNTNNLVAKESVLNSDGYSRFMEGLKTAIYKTAKVNFKTACKCGETYVEMVIDTAGNIGQIKVTTSNRPKIDEMFVQAVQKIKKWNIAELNGKSVNVLLKLNLAFENVYKE